MLMKNGPPLQHLMWTLLFVAFNGDTNEAAADADAFPNPVTEPQLCNRSRPSFICNPDAVLLGDEAARLDLLAFNLRRSTICVCNICDSRHLGASFGAHVAYNVSSTSGDLRSVAKQLRQQWKLGNCEDDIVVVVMAETKEAAFDMGSAIESVITKELGQKIFDECAVHFENSNFYQGLESMVNSYHDILRRFQRPRKRQNRSNLSMILGISLGVIALLVFVAAILMVVKYRTVNKRYKRQFQHKAPLGLQESVVKKQHFEYHLCNAADEFTMSRNGSGVSDEDNESDEDNTKYDPAKLMVPLTRTKRQLSDVAEENEEESEGSVRTVIANPQTGKVLCTEL